MTPLADLIRKLGVAGCSIEQIAVAVEAQEQQSVSRARHQSEVNAARQRRWRDKQQRNVTSQAVSDSDKGQPTIDASTLLPSSSVSDSQESKKVVVARPRGSRLPPGWTLSNADACFALPLVGERRMAQETEKFRDYWHARAGPGGVKLDWAATWRTWIRKAGENGKPNGKSNSTMDAFDDLIADAGGAVAGDPPMRDVTPRGGHVG